MRAYQFIFLTRSGARPAMDFAECGDDGEAAASAFRHLGQHGTCDGVEVYDGARLVMRMDRSQGRPAPVDTRVHGSR